MIFDFDGVIVDSFEDQFVWFKYICELTGKPFEYNSSKEFRKDYKPPAYPYMYEFLGFDWDKEKELIWQEYHKHKENTELQLCQGIEDTIKILHKKGLKLAIASSNTVASISKELEQKELKDYFLTIVGKEDLSLDENGDPRIKPYPDCIVKALERIDCDLNKVFYVGDTPEDIIACTRVKEQLDKSIPMIGVTYGYSDFKELTKYEPRFIVTHPALIIGITNWAETINDLGE